LRTWPKARILNKTWRGQLSTPITDLGFKNTAAARHGTPLPDPASPKVSLPATNLYFSGRSIPRSEARFIRREKV
jgi:hypothetical protein